MERPPFFLKKGKMKRKGSDIMANRDQYHDGYVDISSGRGPQRRRPKKKNRAKKVIISIFSVLLILVGAGVWVFYYMFGGLHINDEIGKKTDEELGITSSADRVFSDDVVNIALYGVDSRDEDSFKGHSDCTMVLSVNTNTGDIKLISILRDTQVEVADGYGTAKLTTAYYWGGPETALRTLNSNFGLNVRDYVTVNFANLAGMIDALGGVEIDVTADEIQEINRNLIEIKKTDHDITDGITGMRLLDGTQAVAYARIRSIDSDNARAGRQQEVLEAMLAAVGKKSAIDYPSLVSQMSQYVETSLSYQEMISLATVLLGKDIHLSTYTIPSDEENAIGGSNGTAWVWQYDLEAASDHIHRIIYEDGE